jgi:hypothetical protein
MDHDEMSGRYQSYTKEWGCEIEGEYRIHTIAWIWEIEG